MFRPIHTNAATQDCLLYLQHLFPQFHDDYDYYDKNRANY